MNLIWYQNFSGKNGQNYQKPKFWTQYQGVVLMPSWSCRMVGKLQIYVAKCPRHGMKMFFFRLGIWFEKSKIIWKKEAVCSCRSDSILSFVTSENSSQTKPGKKYFSGNVKTALLVYFFKSLMQNSGDTSLNKIEYAVTKFKTNRLLINFEWIKM